MCLSVQVCGCVCLCKCVCVCAGVSQLCGCGHVGVSEQMLACLYMCVWGMSVCTGVRVCAGVWVCLCRCGCHELIYMVCLHNYATL